MSNILVVKYGGHAMSDDSGLFAKALGQALAKDLKVVVVHGGAPQVNAELITRGINPRFIGGFRYTDLATLEVAEEVLANQVGPAVTAALIAHAIPAHSLSGRRMIKAETLTQLVDGTSVDLGFVGRITAVDANEIQALLDQGKVPVISPVASNCEGTGALNVNGDLVAAAIAGALDAMALIVMTDVPGIYRNWPDRGSLISSISRDDLFAIKNSFADGMSPKVAACIEAIDNGARAVRIIDGKDPEAFALALENSGGTLVSA
jgi:acetylglutamate kinase